MGRKKKKVAKPWCWYCNREFEDEKILIQHQKAKHFKCHICHKKLYTGPGLIIHCMQVHKETVDKIPNALPHRNNIEIEIYGMEGIPDSDLKEHEEQRKSGGLPKNGQDDSSDDEQPPVPTKKAKPIEAPTLAQPTTPLLGTPVAPPAQAQFRPPMPMNPGQFNPHQIPAQMMQMRMQMPGMMPGMNAVQNIHGMMQGMPQQMFPGNPYVGQMNPMAPHPLAAHPMNAMQMRMGIGVNMGGFPGMIIPGQTPAGLIPNLQFQSAMQQAQQQAQAQQQHQQHQQQQLQQHRPLFPAAAAAAAAVAATRAATSNANTLTTPGATISAGFKPAGSVPNNPATLQQANPSSPTHSVPPKSSLFPAYGNSGMNVPQPHTPQQLPPRPEEKEVKPPPLITPPGAGSKIVHPSEDISLEQRRAKMGRYRIPQGGASKHSISAPPMLHSNSNNNSSSAVAGNSGTASSSPPTSINNSNGNFSNIAQTQQQPIGGNQFRPQHMGASTSPKGAFGGSFQQQEGRAVQHRF